MKIAYYPGCTLKTKAKNLEDAALASLKVLGVEVEELTRWNCCGAVYSLANDDLIHQVGPVRDLIRAQDAGATKVMTLCSQCYNVLARANLMMREDEEKRKTINDFMYEENDYKGELEVVHFLDLIREEVGFDKLKEKVKVPLTDLKVAPFYGCTLIRPQEVALDGEIKPVVLHDFIAALGATPVEYGAAEECCGAYEILVHPEEGMRRSSKVLNSAQQAGADALILSCPLCEYNLGKKQKDIMGMDTNIKEMPVFYFTQLLAVALGIDAEQSRFDLNVESARSLLEERKYLSAG